MDIEKFIELAASEIKNAQTIMGNDDGDEVTKLLYHNLLESIIEFGMANTGYDRAEIAKIVENIVSQPKESTVNDNNAFFVPGEYLNIETVQMVDKELKADEPAMLCDLYTGEIKAQCYGHHIWKLSF